MDSLMNQIARELTEAVSAAVASDARVEACRDRARAAGYELRLSLDAVVSFGNKDNVPGKAATSRKSSGRSALEMSAGDRRFLKSLRIAADEPTEKEVE